MELRQLRYLVAVADELNFTRAAERCNVSQPPLSRAINQLEAELGFRLFDRDTHRVTATSAGISMIKHARSALETLREGVDQSRGITNGIRGTLTIGFGGAPIYSLLPTLINSYRELARDVRFEFRAMSIGDQVSALRDGSIDLGIVRLPLSDELLETQYILSEPLVVALPVSHPALLKKGSIAIDQLASSRFLTYLPYRGFHYHADLIALCKIADFNPIVAQELPTTESIIGMVACGVGVALVPASARRLRMRGVAFRNLEVSGLPVHLGTVKLALAWNRNQVSSLIRDFAQHCASQQDGI